MSDAELIEAPKPKNKGGRPRKTPPVRAEDDAVEISYWGSVQNSRDPGDLESYLERWPDGHFAELATRRVRQLLQAEAGGGEPEMYAAPVKRKAVVLPSIPRPPIDPGKEPPRYLLLAAFFAENHTYYAPDQELSYWGPPNEHMLPVNEPARIAKREQEEFLDACWVVKCKAEGRPVGPRPKELADQIETERNLLRAQGNVVAAPELPPTRPDLARSPITNPRAALVGEAKPSQRYADRPSASGVPMLGSDGARYQRDNSIPSGGTPLASIGGTKAL